MPGNALSNGLDRTMLAPFNPLSLFAGGQAGGWYDPSDLTTLFQNSNGTGAVTADSDPVGYMADKSGNGNHLIQATAGQRPLYKTSGGLHWLQFDGGDDTLADTFSAIAQPFDRLSAIRMDSWANNSYVFDGGAADEAILRQIGVTPELALYAGSAACTNSAGTLSANHVVTERFNGASSSLKIDTTEVTGNPGAQGITGLTAGLRPGGGAACPVNLYGLIVRGALSAAELANAQAFLAVKAGL